MWSWRTSSGLPSSPAPGTLVSATLFLTHFGLWHQDFLSHWLAGWFAESEGWCIPVKRLFPKMGEVTFTLSSATDEPAPVPLSQQQQHHHHQQRPQSQPQSHKPTGVPPYISIEMPE